jgi:type I restriction enzyme S subunit
MRNKELLFEAQTLSTGGSEELLSVSHLTGVGPRSEKNVTMTEAESLDGYRVVKQGDLVINTMWAWMGALGVSRHTGIVSPAYGVYRPRPSASFEPRFFDYLYRSPEYVMEMTRVSRGIWSSRLRIYPEVFLRMAVPVPPQEEQRAIADYLDRETARVDTLIAEQQRLIEMLRERRDSAWAVAVDQAYQSGREIDVRRVITSIVDGPFGSSLTSEHYSDEGARVIRLGNIGINEFKDADEAFIPLDYADELGAHEAKRNDVVVAGLGDDKMPLGRAAVVPDIGRAIVKADCYRLRPNRLVSSEYLAWVMSAPQTRSQIMLLARGATRLRLNTKVVQQVKIPVLNRDEQDALVAQSVAEATKIDALIAEAERFIELAHERRSALITAAVTGQIDVREAA